MSSQEHYKLCYPPSTARPLVAQGPLFWYPTKWPGHYAQGVPASETPSSTIDSVLTPGTTTTNASQAYSWEHATPRARLLEMALRAQPYRLARQDQDFWGTPEEMKPSSRIWLPKPPPSPRVEKTLKPIGYEVGLMRQEREARARAADRVAAGAEFAGCRPLSPDRPDAARR